MFKLLKKIFGGRGSNAPANTVTTASAGKPTGSKNGGTPVPAARNPEAAPGVECASLSLRAILDRFPADLKSNVGEMPGDDVKIILPVNAIMKQLPAGSVRMSLGSLFRQAPAGTFLKTNIDDKRMVEVPLAEVFKSINLAKLNRRNDQRSVDVPDDVEGLFGADGKTKSVTRGQAASAPAAPAAPVPEAQPSDAPRLRMPGVTPPAPASSIRDSAIRRPMPTENSGSSFNLNGDLSLALVEIAGRLAGWNPQRAFRPDW